MPGPAIALLSLNRRRELKASCIRMRMSQAITRCEFHKCRPSLYDTNREMLQRFEWDLQAIAPSAQHRAMSTSLRSKFAARSSGRDLPRIDRLNVRRRQDGCPPIFSCGRPFFCQVALDRTYPTYCLDSPLWFHFSSPRLALLCLACCADVPPEVSCQGPSSFAGRVSAPNPLPPTIVLDTRHSGLLVFLTGAGCARQPNSGGDQMISTIVLGV